MSLTETLRASVRLNGVKGTAVVIIVFLLLLAGGFVLYLSGSLHSAYKRIDTKCNELLVRINTWRT